MSNVYALAMRSHIRALPPGIHNPPVLLLVTVGFLVGEGSRDRLSSFSFHLETERRGAKEVKVINVCPRIRWFVFFVVGTQKAARTRADVEIAEIGEGCPRWPWSWRWSGRERGEKKRVEQSGDENIDGRGEEERSTDTD
jgi:hypothetical protein